MRNVRLAAVAALVGALTMAPTELLPAIASARATATSGSLSVGTAQFQAVAGSSSAATATLAYALPSFTAGCTASSTTSGSTASGSTQINLSATTGLVVGMVVTGPAGIPAGSKIVSIKTTATRNIVISKITTATINSNTSISANGCWQQYFNVNNIKPLALVSFGISQAVTSSGTDTITLQKCAGTWTESTGVCSGAITTIVTTTVGVTSAVFTVATALAASTGTARLRALATINGITSTISINVRAGTDLGASIPSNS